MAKDSRTVVGVELLEHAIRVVEVSVGNAPVILAAGEAVMPAHALRAGVVVNAELIAASLRNLLVSLGVTSTDAVLGLPSGSSILRTLAVPPAEDKELQFIVDGEVKYFRLLSTDHAAYGFFPMRAAHGSEIGDAVSVLLAGAEGPIIAGVHNVATRAALNVVAVESPHLAMYRAAAEQLPGPSTLVLNLGETQSSVVLHSKGEICLFRELDLGTRSILIHRDGEDPFMDPKSMAEGEHDAATLNENLVLPGPCRALALEVRRSIEYFEREYKGEAAIDRVLVTVAESGAKAIIPWMSGELGLPVEMVSKFKAPIDKPTTKGTMAPPDGARFATCYGLAARAGAAANTKIPCIDLFVHERSAAEMEVKRKGVAGSLLLAIALVSAGAYASYFFGVKANLSEHALEHLQEDIEEKQAITRQTSAEAMRQRQQVDILIADGVPVSAIMDTVASKVSPEVGLAQFEANNTGKLTVGGEALDENSAIRLADALKSAPLMVSANLTSIEKVDPEGSKMGLKFLISAQGRFGRPPQTKEGGQ